MPGFARSATLKAWRDVMAGLSRLAKTLKGGMSQGKAKQAGHPSKGATVCFTNSDSLSHLYTGMRATQVDSPRELPFS